MQSNARQSIMDTIADHQKIRFSFIMYQHMLALKATEKLKKLAMRKKIKIKPKEDGKEKLFI